MSKHCGAVWQHVIIFKPFTHYSLSNCKKYHFSPFASVSSKIESKVPIKQNLALDTCSNCSITVDIVDDSKLEVPVFHYMRKKVGNQKFMKQAACYLSCLFITFCVLITKRKNLPSIFIIYFTFVFTNHIFSDCGFMLPKLKFWLLLILSTSHRLFGDLNHNPVVWSLKGIKNVPKVALNKLIKTMKYLVV